MTTQKGFTLVELAIALMVIGLLIGGVLKGQELIENAKITATIRQIKAYDTATMIFRNTYGSLPGDTKRPNRIPNCNTPICNLPGNGDGKIQQGVLDNVEVFNFFPHLTKAGMIQGPEGGTDADMTADKTDLWFPSSQYDMPLTLRSNSPIYTDFENDISTSGNAYNMPARKGIITANAAAPTIKTMVALDSKMDDGKPFSGDVQVVIYNDCLDGVSDNEYPNDEALSDSCSLLIRAGF